MVTVDESLDDWQSLAKRYEWPLMLTGNGASIAVSRRFRYDSLYVHAPLDRSDRRIFNEIDTTNFELVLDSLRHASAICGVLGHSSSDAAAHYSSVQQALIRAVRAVHPGWNEVPPSTDRAIEGAISQHEVVFTTNYDLLSYWAIMSHRPWPRVRDLFWGTGNTFDMTNTALRGTATVILYLHGGLHLYQDSVTGATGKWSGTDSLLNLSSRLGGTTRKRSLFVSEARSVDKLRSIRGSDYLSFAYEQLATDERSIVVFGHSLSDGDRHIVDALNSAPRTRRVAFSLRPDPNPHEIIAAKTRIRNTLTSARVHFFDSTTHPLGDLAIRIR